MPIDNGTIAGKTNIDELTAVLSDDNREFFTDTYSFYLVTLVLAGKSIFYGRGHFATITFAGCKNYVFPNTPSTNASEEEKKQYRQQTKDKIDKIKDLHKNPAQSDDFFDIVHTLVLAARRAVSSFLQDVQCNDKRRQFVEDRRAKKVTIRQTLQINFWNEIKQCIDQKFFAFRSYGNLYYIYIPKTSAKNDPKILLDNIDEDGNIEILSHKSFSENFAEADGEKETERREQINEQIEQERVLRDSWDIRRYRIFLVKQVGDNRFYQLKSLSPMKCYALYYDLCDRTPFLEMIQDQKERQHYEETRKWSDQMIADILKLDQSIPEKDRNRISRENVKNYRKGYADELVKWLVKNVPGLPVSSAKELVTENNIRFENMASFFFQTHIHNKTLFKHKEYLRWVYKNFVDKEKTLKL